MRRRSPLSPVSYVRRRSFRRGVRGNNRFWLFVYALFFGRELVGRSPYRWARSGVPLWRFIVGAHAVHDVVKSVTSPPAEFLGVERLRPGEFVRVEAIDPATLSPEERRLYRR
jgi:hypothetical protein